VLYSVAGSEKNSKTFVPLFMVLKRGHEILPTVFALWRAPGLLPRFSTHAAVAAKLIKSPPADLFLPGVMLAQEGARWKKNDLVSVCVTHNPLPFAVGRASCSSEEAIASGMTGTACVIVHHYLDHMWNLHPESPEGFYEDRVDIPAAIRARLEEEREERRRRRRVQEEEQAQLTKEKGEGDGGSDPPPAPSADPGSREAVKAAVCGDAPADAAVTLLDDNDDDGTAKEAMQTGDGGGEEKQNAIEITSSSEDSDSDSDDDDDDHNDDEPEDPKAAMDALMLDVMLIALSSVPKTAFPILANVFNSNYFLPSRPGGTTINVKQSSFGKFGVFLQHVEECYGWMALGSAKKKPADGVLRIASVDKSAIASSLQRRGVRKNSGVGSGGSGGSGGASGSPVVCLDLFKAPAAASFIFEALPEVLLYGLLFRKGRDLGAKKRKIVRLYTRGDVARVVSSYVDAHGLVVGNGKHQVRLDAPLCDFAFSKPYPTMVGKKQLAKAAVKNMQQWHTIVRERSGDAGAWVQREQMRQRQGGSSKEVVSLAWHELPPAVVGLPKKITIWVERNKQRGDKFLTTVQNLESYGVDVKALASRGNRLFACKTLAQKDPRKPRTDKALALVLAGNLANKVVVELGRPTGGMGIPAKFFEIKKQKGI
jgi:translation initiation factor 2D